MKKTGKIGLFLVGALLITMLGGCGNAFDASGYLNALLDNSYKNDAAAFIDMKIGTEEEAAQVYAEGIEKELEGITSSVELADELEAEYAEVMKDLLKGVKYTVGEAEKVEDGFLVPVKYQPMIVFAPTMEAYTKETTAYLEELQTKIENGELEVTSEEELTEELTEASFTMLKDCLKEAVVNATYGEETELTVKLNVEDNVCTPAEEDLEKLEESLFDLDALQVQ